MQPNSSCGYINIRSVVINCNTHRRNQNQVRPNQVKYNKIFSFARNALAFVGFFSVIDYLLFYGSENLFYVRNLFGSCKHLYTAYERLSDDYEDLLLEYANLYAHECIKFCLRNICGQIGVDDDHLIEGPSSNLIETALASLDNQCKSIG